MRKGCDIQMETLCLIDFENVHNEGLENIDSLTQRDHVHIFSTENALNIRMDFVLSKGIDIEGHIVPAHKQSLDMHLVSYLGYLLGKYGQQGTYIIISKDKDYDDVIKFWKDKGYPNISRKQKIPRNLVNQKKTVTQAVTDVTVQTVNRKINTGMAYDFGGEDRSELNLFMQRGMRSKGYSVKDANRICKCVIVHCNDERILSGIHNDLKKEYDNALEVYEDVKTVLGKFAASKSKVVKRESQVRSFVDSRIRKRIYVDSKEEIINIILNARTRQQVNNELMRLYLDGNIVKPIYQTIQPLIKELPGK